MTDTNQTKPIPNQAERRAPTPPENSAQKSRPNPIPDGEAIAELGDRIGGPA
jgi:hypothetical protein